MGKKSISRWNFAFALMGTALAWAGQALSPASPGGEEITSEEIVDLVVKVLAPMGITVDPAMFKASIKELA